MATLVERMMVRPGEAAKLDRRDAREHFGVARKQGEHRLGALLTELKMWQNHLWAEARRSVLLILQGLDASGKDGTIKAVFSGVNPQGCRVVSFKVPAGVELEHDYLWRAHANCPRRGEIGIFNRSHYEDIVAVRVRELLPSSRWKARYRHVREFERLLDDEGTTVVKAFLHISSDEQRKRLQKRIDDPEKRWKFRVEDLDDRSRWDAYHLAYEDVLGETSTPWAPWYVIPADSKWFRNLAVAELLVSTLARLDPKIPRVADEIAHLQVR